MIENKTESEKKWIWFQRDPETMPECERCTHWGPRENIIKRNNGEMLCDECWEIKSS